MRIDVLPEFTSFGICKLSLPVSVCPSVRVCVCEPELVGGLTHYLIWIRRAKHLGLDTYFFHLSSPAKKHSIATITKLRSLELLIKTPLLHILYYINGLTHDFWTRTGGWEFDRSHGAGTSSPSHWQQVEEQAPKPVGWTMCFLLMTLVPVQKLCVNIYVYICVHSLYEFCYRSYIQRECHSVLAKLHPITFYRGVRGSWSECHFVFSLVYQLCLALW